MVRKIQRETIVKQRKNRENSKWEKVERGSNEKIPKVKKENNEKIIEKVERKTVRKNCERKQYEIEKKK